MSTSLYSRRVVLRAVGLGSVGVAASTLISACGGGTAGPAVSTSPAAQPATATAPPGPTATSVAAPTAATTALATAASPTAAANPTSATTGKLVFTSSTLGNMDKIYPPILKKFTDANPGIAIDGVYAAASVPDYETKLLLMMSGGTPPDVYWVHTYINPALSTLNVPQDLTTYIQNDKSFKLDALYPASVKDFAFQGKQNGLPRETTSTVLVYNKDIFKKAEVDFPAASWTWADHDRAVEKLTSGNGPGKTYGSAGWIQVGYIYYSLIKVWQDGGDVVNADRTKYTLDQDPGVKVYTWIQDLVKKGFHPSSAEGQAGDPATLFNTGRVAMIPSFSSFSFYANAKFEWDIQHLPHDGGQTQTTRTASAGHSMTQASKVKDLSWKLLSWLAGPDGMQLFSDQAGLTVAYKSIAEQAITRLAGKPPANLKVAFDALGYARPEPVVGDWLGIHKTIANALEGVYGPEKKPVKDTLSSVADQVNQLITARPKAG